MDIQNELFKLQDEAYGDFQSKLTPNIKRETVIGVRVPQARTLAKRIYKEGMHFDFVSNLPHKYYDENMLHSMIISEEKNYDTCLKMLDEFLPYVDNWAVCDTMSPKVFKKNKDKLIDKIYEWTKSPHVYTSRFGIEMLMRHYLDDDFEEEYLELPASVYIEDYYFKMMVAWFYATALAFKWDETIPYLEEHRLEKWIHNKTIQKARESYRITPDQKDYLKTLKL